MEDRRFLPRINWARHDLEELRKVDFAEAKHDKGRPGESVHVMKKYPKEEE